MVKLIRVSFYASVIFIFTYELRNINNKQMCPLWSKTNSASP